MFSFISVSLPLSNDGPLNTPPTLPIPPPRIPAAIPTSRYSAIASGLSNGLPACQRSNTCWDISVGTSDNVPWPAP